MKEYHFKKSGRDWYIDLPEFIEQGGDVGDLQMVEGADTMLDLIAKGRNEVALCIAREPFENADELILTKKCDPYVGGGYYLMKEFEGEIINKTMWLCQVIEFVFNDIPSEIYIKKQNA